jgi:hypothetical protein
LPGADILPPSEPPAATPAALLKRSRRPPARSEPGGFIFALDYAYMTPNEIQSGKKYWIKPDEAPVQAGHKYLIPFQGALQWVRVHGPGEDRGFWLCEVSGTGELIDVPWPILEMNAEPATATTDR